MRTVPAVLFGVALAFCWEASAAVIHRRQPEPASDDDDQQDSVEAQEVPAVSVANVAMKIESTQTPPKPASEASADANSAAAAANQAAALARKVSAHSVDITQHAQSALKLAHDAVQRARSDSRGLDTNQKTSLQKAEMHLKRARTEVDYGADLDGQKRQVNGGTRGKRASEVEIMREDVEELRKQLDLKRGLSDDQEIEEIDAELKELENELKKLEESGGGDSGDHKALKAEIKRLQKTIDGVQPHGDLDVKLPKAKDDTSAKGDEDPGNGKLTYRIPSDEEKEKERGVAPMRTLGGGGSGSEYEASSRGESGGAPVMSKGIDIDTEMPYGELEPFGREDTAQELTEASIHQSDEMVDQLERAEVAEEKRAVFRALTRLRGAAITSFDGVARSQTGNIDEYNKVHQWRTAHPLHHLADEESDISKWAFPDNADF